MRLPLHEAIAERLHEAYQRVFLLARESEPSNELGVHVLESHLAAQGDELRADLPDRRAIVLAEIGDGLVIRDEPSVILEEKDWPRWLGEEPAMEEELKALLMPCADERLKMWPVHKKVGNVRNNSRDLAEPVIEQGILF